MSPRTRVIAFLVALPFELLNLAGPVSVFSHPTQNGKPFYTIKLLTTQRSAYAHSTSGISLSPVTYFEDYTGAIDTLIAVGGEGSMVAPSKPLVQWIRKRATRVNRLASVCTGAFLLAATGLLDGQRVTTHWQHVDELIQQYKHLRVDRDPIYRALPQSSSALRLTENGIIRLRS
jgi:transcriptional regulator GlxA family with amidase domain